MALMDRELDREIIDAEQAYAASLAALRTHGHQSLTWKLLEADGRRLKELRAQKRGE